MSKKSVQWSGNQLQLIENEQHDKNNNQPQEVIDKPRGPMSAYAFFVKLYKPETGEKFSMSQYGEIWKNMSQDYKDKYVKLAQDDKLRFQMQMEAWMAQQQDQKEVDPNNEDEDDPDSKTYFPVSRIKFILKQDEDFKLPIRKEAYQYIQRASELFAQQLLLQCRDHIQLSKRKKFIEEDLYAIIKEREEYEFLECIIQEQSHEAAPRAEPKQQKVVHNVGNTLYQYFKKN